MKYIKLPINLLEICKDKHINLCSLEESIAQSIMIIITTRFGEVAGKIDYGSMIWELEFNQFIKMHEWEEQVKKSLLQTIKKYEKRLFNISLDVELTEIVDRLSVKEQTQIRRKADISLKGNIIYSEVPFYFNTSLYISPLSQ